MRRNVEGIEIWSPIRLFILSSLHTVQFKLFDGQPNDFIHDMIIIIIDQSTGINVSTESLLAVPQKQFDVSYKAF